MNRLKAIILKNNIGNQEVRCPYCNKGWILNTNENQTIRFDAHQCIKRLPSGTQLGCGRVFKIIYAEKPLERLAERLLNGSAKNNQ